MRSLSLASLLAQRDRRGARSNQCVVRGSDRAPQARAKRCRSAEPLLSSSPTARLGEKNYCKVVARNSACRFFFRPIDKSFCLVKHPRSAGLVGDDLAFGGLRERRFCAIHGPRGREKVVIVSWADRTAPTTILDQVVVNVPGRRDEAQPQYRKLGFHSTVRGHRSLGLSDRFGCLPGDWVCSAIHRHLSSAGAIRIAATGCDRVFGSICPASDSRRSREMNFVNLDN